ncbi:MAG: sctD [Chlamydiales bacterium]|jgi:type III secretion system YscD/HrpQ family protein|nr:sctD [Chlamydiales bacterium]
MAAQLIVEEGSAKGSSFELSAENSIGQEGKVWLLGHTSDCSFVIEDLATNAQQLSIRSTDSGYFLENHSTEPLMVNGHPLEDPLLQDQDLISAGTLTLRFLLKASALKTSNVEEDMAHLDEKTAVAEMPLEHTEFDEQHMKEIEDSFAEVNFDLIGQEGRWLLKVISGPNAGAEFSMQADKSYLVGTDTAACDLVFHDASVSRQHAKFSVDHDEVLSIEDLNSRNGTRIDGELIKGQRRISSNTLVTMGTTTFLLIDQEGERSTIISPPLYLERERAVEVPAKEAEKKEGDPSQSSDSAAPPRQESAKEEEKVISSLGGLMLLAIITGIFVFIGFGTSMLFRSDELIVEKVDVVQKIEQALAESPDVKFTYTKQTGRLLLLGHVLTTSDKEQIRHSLKTLPDISYVDDNIVIDELVWKEVNGMIGKNPSWKGISVNATRPGHFVLSGYLTSYAEGEKLFDWVNKNFNYLDLLERRIIIEEDVLNQVSSKLSEKGFKGITPYLPNGELVLRGSLIPDQRPVLEVLLREFEKIPGVKSVRLLTDDAQAPSSIVNLSDRYQVTGASFQGGSSLNVVINGRILTKGDTLDGMTLLRIEENAIFLEKDGFQYKIDFNRYR